MILWVDVKTAGEILECLAAITIVRDLKRIGKSNSDAFAVGDHISIFGLQTDYPQDGVDAGSLLTHGARFKPTGALAINYQVAA